MWDQGSKRIGKISAEFSVPIRLSRIYEHIHMKVFSEVVTVKKFRGIFFGVPLSNYLSCGDLGLISDLIRKIITVFNARLHAVGGMGNAYVFCNSRDLFRLRWLRFSPDSTDKMGNYPIFKSQNRAHFTYYPNSQILKP